MFARQNSFDSLNDDIDSDSQMTHHRSIILDALDELELMEVDNDPNADQTDNDDNESEELETLDSATGSVLFAAHTSTIKLIEDYSKMNRNEAVGLGEVNEFVEKVVGVVTDKLQKIINVFTVQMTDTTTSSSWLVDNITCVSPQLHDSYAAVIDTAPVLLCSSDVSSKAINKCAGWPGVTRIFGTLVVGVHLGVHRPHQTAREPDDKRKGTREDAFDDIHLSAVERVFALGKTVDTTVDEKRKDKKRLYRPTTIVPQMPIHRRPANVGAKTRFQDTSSPRKGLYDYIIVGGGTAGCVLASRLTEDPNVSVLLLERGGVHNTFVMRCPLLSGLFNQEKHPSVRWDTTPLTAANGRVLEILTGTVLGGASRFNAMLYTRGSAAQYDEWGRQGRVGWSYADLEPYFIKSENAVSTSGNHHGSAGPWSNQHFDKLYFSPFPNAVKAAHDLGISYTEDVNAPEGPCVSCAKLHVTMTPDGKRLSTFDAFLPPSVIRQRKRLDICSNTLVTKIDFEADGIQAVACGVFFKPFNSPAIEQTFYARARKEIIVCCGAIETPHLLLSSGIGAKDHISKHGIKVIKDLPGVGHNLQDHAGIIITYKVPLSDSFHSLENSFTRASTEFLKYLIRGRGLFTYPTLQVSIFAKSDTLGSDAKFSFDHTNREAFPDIEIMPIPSEATYVRSQKSQGFFSFICVPLRPKSSGTIELHSHDPHASPKVDLGFFTDVTDFEVARKALRLGMKLGEKMRANGYQMEDYLIPAGDSNEQLDTFIRQGVRTTYHYSSSCRMAPEHDAVPGVVDDELRVHGVSRLRIADASIFPDVVATHLQAPVVMVAEKCADMLKKTWSATSW
ncbi:hypothetical protein BDR04DRAFT_1229142 [Suillus decipiens]|nr:hypothetical protein BDR04DRAFT_1229142 [Suillus decipiens]